MPASSAQLFEHERTLPGYTCTKLHAGLRDTYRITDKNQSFKRYLNGTLIKALAFEKQTDAGFFDEEYAIPNTLQQVDILTFRLEATKEATAGNIYDVRLIK